MGVIYTKPFIRNLNLGYLTVYTGKGTTDNCVGVECPLYYVAELTQSFFTVSQSKQSRIGGFLPAKASELDKCRLYKLPTRHHYNKKAAVTMTSRCVTAEGVCV